LNLIHLFWISGIIMFFVCISKSQHP
jgi:hypothetical protein